MNASPTPPDGHHDPDPDPSASLKVAGLAVLAWAVIGALLRVTRRFELSDELFAGALLVPALVGVGLSVRAILKGGPSRALATIGLMVNVMLVVGAILLWLSVQSGW